MLRFEGIAYGIFVALGIVLTAVITFLTYQWFGVIGVIIGWFTMLIPTAAYIVGLPFMLLFATVVAALERNES